MTTQNQDTDGNRPVARKQRPERANTGTVKNRLKRVGAVGVGGVLLVRGLRRRSLRGTATALVGGWLLFRALRGDARVERALGPRENRGGREESRTETSDTTSVSRSVTVGEPAEELYEAWRDPELFSRIVGHIADVTSVDDDRYRWTVHGPRGRDVSWETRTVTAEPGEFLRWETAGDTLASAGGSVRFRPASGDRGTVVTLSVTVDPPGGALGSAVLKRLGIVPEALAGETLRRFKSLVESGEIPTLSGNPSTRGTGDLL